MKKKIWWAGGVLAIVIAIASYLFVFQVDGAIQSALKKYGSDATQTAVDIQSVDMSVRTGEGTINDFRLSNPKSFFPPKAIKVDEINFQVDDDMIRSEKPIIIEVLNINAPTITYAVGNDHVSNWDVIDKNLRNPLPVGSLSSSRKIMIKDLYIRDGTVIVTHPLLRLRQVSAALPVIHLSNIGQGDGLGVSFEEITRQVLSEISKQSAAVGVEVLKKEIKTSNPFPPHFFRESESRKNADKGYMER